MPWREGCSLKILQEVERIDNSMPKHYFSEHLARYAFIRDKLSQSSRVLDLGCGVGYGCRSVCESTSDLVGLDVSLEAIRKARSIYSHPKIEYMVARGESLPFRDSSFNAVISFEVIEHISQEHQPFYLSEIVRVLKPDGVAFLSTPNRKFTAGRANPYHLKEFYFDELKHILFQHFAVVGLYGQTCSNSVAGLYKGKAASKVRKVKEFLRVQFLLPHWAKRLMEFCLTGSTMAKVEIEDYRFVDQPIDECEAFVAVCRKYLSNA